MIKRLVFVHEGVLQTCERRDEKTERKYKRQLNVIISHTSTGKPDHQTEGNHERRRFFLFFFLCFIFHRTHN